MNFLYKTWNAIKHYDELLERVTTLSEKIKSLESATEYIERGVTTLEMDLNVLRKENKKCGEYKEEISTEINSINAAIAKINSKLNKKGCKKSADEIYEFLCKLIDNSSLEKKETLFTIVNDFFSKK